MGLSETIVAAMIGAAATVGTALFQLLTAFKARGKTDAKPRRGNTMRSVFAVLALMAASAAGGFLYSQLLREREREDIRAMRQEMHELRELAASHAGVHEPVPMTAAVAAPVDSPIQMTALEAEEGVAESIAYVPACRPALSAAPDKRMCDEAEGQRIALCATVPTLARIGEIHLFAQPDAAQQPWDQHTAMLESDLGGARFTGKTFEYAQGHDTRALCVNFLHWSSEHPHIVRIVVEYRRDDASIVPLDTDPPEALPAMASQTVQAAPQTAGIVSSPAAAAALR